MFVSGVCSENFATCLLGINFMANVMLLLGMAKFSRYGWSTILIVWRVLWPSQI